MAGKVCWHYCVRFGVKARRERPCTPAVEATRRAAMTDRASDNDNELIDELAGTAARDTARGDDLTREIGWRDEPALPIRQD
jgi:hypothetical protein